MTGSGVCRCLFGLAGVVGAAAAVAQPAGFGETHSRVTLVSERDALVPGETAMLGLLFEIEDGWHIYQPSQNDTGLEPIPEWSSDGELTFGAIQWPAGHRFTQPGEILDHGYEGSVLLMLPVEVAGSVAAGTSVTISADVEWLACDAEMCVPGEAEVSVTLPVRGSAGPSGHAEAFESARAGMGVDLSRAAGEGVSVAWDGAAMVVRTERAGVLSFVPDQGCSRVRGLFAAGSSGDGALRLEFAGEGEPVVGWIRFDGVVGHGGAQEGSGEGASEVWWVRTRVGEALMTAP